MLWLVSGNLFIGIFEWSLACKILRRPLSQGMFIVANYLSAGAGVWAVAWLTARVDFTLAGFTGLALMWSGAFALTLLVEFAPLWFQLRREPVECKTLIMTLVKVNLASYAVIFPLSFLLGSTKMWREVSVVAPSAVSVP